MPCIFKKTVELIYQQENDYLITLKKNQGNLYKQVVQLSETTEPLSQSEHTQKGHGRKITRTIGVFDLPIEVKKVWAGALRFMKVSQVGSRQGNPYQEVHYYLTSLTLDAAVMQSRTQAHWGIENRLHWVKDVVFQEDNASIKTPKAASTMAILRNLATSLFRRHGHPSMIRAIDLLGNDLKRLLPMLGVFPD